MAYRVLSDFSHMLRYRDAFVLFGELLEDGGVDIVYVQLVGFWDLRSEVLGHGVSCVWSAGDVTAVCG